MRYFRVLIDQPKDDSPGMRSSSKRAPPVDLKDFKKVLRPGSMGIAFSVMPQIFEFERGALMLMSSVSDRSPPQSSYNI